MTPKNGLNFRYFVLLFKVQFSKRLIYRFIGVRAKGEGRRGFQLMLEIIDSLYKNANGITSGG